MRLWKVSLAIALILTAGILGTVQADDAAAAKAQAKEDFVFTRAVIQSGRTEIMTKTISMTREEREAFAPIYLDYWAEMNLLSNRYYDLIYDFAQNYENLSDEKALEIVDEYMKIDKERSSVRRKYVKKFKKVLEPKNVLRFFQVENKLDAMIIAELAAEIPLAK